MPSSPIPMPAEGYTLAGAGVITDDGRFVPNDTDNLDWQAYQEWIVDGNVPDPDPATLADVRTKTKAQIDVDASLHRTALFPAGDSSMALAIIRWEEADLAAADGTPTGGEYPVINAEVGFNGSTLAQVATNIQSERNTKKTAMAAIETTRNVAKAAVDAAGSVAAVQAVYAAITWP